MAEASTSPRHIQFGPHSVTIEPDGLMTLTFHGDSTIEHAKEILAIIHEHGAKHGAYLFVLDVSDLGTINAGARATWVVVDKPYPFSRIIAYAPDFSKRMLVATMYRAGQLLVPAYFHWEMDFVATMEEARLLIERYRA